MAMAIDLHLELVHKMSEDPVWKLWRDFALCLPQLPDEILAHLVHQLKMQIPRRRHNNTHRHTLRLVPGLELMGEAVLIVGIRESYWS